MLNRKENYKMKKENVNKIKAEVKGKDISCFLEQVIKIQNQYFYLYEREKNNNNTRFSIALS